MFDKGQKQSSTLSCDSSYEVLQVITKQVLTPYCHILISFVLVILSQVGCLQIIGVVN